MARRFPSPYLDALARGTLVYDGAMGTNIQRAQLSARDFGGDALAGCNDNLILTRPDLIERIHGSFLGVGCDVVETNTFRAAAPAGRVGPRPPRPTRSTSAPHPGAPRRRPARHARAAPLRGRLDGPDRHAALVLRPGALSITGDALERIFFEQARALIDGGADAILIETQQDILELRAAVLGADAARRERGRRVPLQAQPTLIDASGRMLLGTDVASALATLERLPARRGGPQLLHRPRRDAGERAHALPEVEPLPSR